MTATPGPPVRLERAVARLTPWSSRADVVGDLREEYVARRRRGAARANTWYAAQAGLITLAAMRASLAGVATGTGRDLLDAWRGLARHRGVMAAPVVSLAVALGLATAVFTVVNGLRLAPLPYPAPDDLVEIDEVHPTEVCAGCSVGAPTSAWPLWTAADSLSEVVAFDAAGVVIRAGGVPDRAVLLAVSHGFFDTLGLRLTAGSLPADSTVRAVVITDAARRRWFDGDANVVGMPLTIGEDAYVVAAVLDPVVPLPGRADAVVVREPGLMSDGRLNVIARLAPGRTVADARAELELLHGRVDGGARVDDGWRPRVRPLREALMDDLDDPSAAGLALTGALLLLLVACLNVCVVLIARVADRTTELAVRRALGAHRGRLARLILAEVGWLAVLAGALALLLAVVARGALVASLGGVLPPWVSFPIDARVLAAAGLLAAAVVLVAGTLPAVAAAGFAERRTAAALRASRAPVPQRRLSVLVGLQAALGVLLVAGTLDASRSALRVMDFSNLRHRVDGLATIATVPAPGAGTDAVARAIRWRGIRDGLLALPAVPGVSGEQMLFLGSSGGPDAASRLRLDGESEAVPDAVVPRHSLAVAPGWFDLMEVPILRGRGIRDGDVAGAPGVVVVSEAAATTLWGDDRDALGRVVHIAGWPVPLTVVGVAADVVGNPLSESRRVLPRVYASLMQAPEELTVTWIVDTADTPQPLRWRELFAGFAPDVVVIEVGTIESGLRRWTASAAGFAAALGVTGVLAMLLLAFGVHGTLRYKVAVSWRELGIRRALGADGGEVASAVLRTSLTAVAVSLCVGGLGAWLLGRGVGAAGLGTADPALIALAACVVVVTALVAAIDAVRRALAVNPVTAIRGS